MRVLCGCAACRCAGVRCTLCVMHVCVREGCASCCVRVRVGARVCECKCACVCARPCAGLDSWPCLMPKRSLWQPRRTQWPLASVDEDQAAASSEPRHLPWPLREEGAVDPSASSSGAHRVPQSLEGEDRAEVIHQAAARSAVPSVPWTLDGFSHPRWEVLFCIYNGVDGDVSSSVRTLMAEHRSDLSSPPTQRCS